MTTHSIKLSAQWFDRVADETKRVEIREAERDYQIGDILELREVRRGGFGLEVLTGRVVTVDVTHVLYNVPGLRSDYVAISIANPKIQESGESATTEGDSQ